MLYKLSQDSGRYRLDGVPYVDFSRIGLVEKDLENLMAENLLDKLFEGSPLMPFFQERQRQSEADIYALDADGDLVLFELKRSEAGKGAVQQILGYAQEAARWDYTRLQEMYSKYGLRDGKDAPRGLADAHRAAFGLESPLGITQFNRKQHMKVIGSAADDDLMHAVDYWQSRGMPIEFLPYRVYEIAGTRYLEFFAPPYDTHSNPGDVKGVIFDTNRSWDSDSVWRMLDQSIVAAFGEAKKNIDYLNTGDYVFFSHTGVGVIAAGCVKAGPIREPDGQTKYREVELLTPRPERDRPWKALTFSEVSDATEKTFYWARTIKVPYLTINESESLLAALKRKIESESGAS